MLKIVKYALISALIFTAVLAGAEGKNPVFNVITVDGVITSPTAKYISASIEEAQNDNAEGLIILLDTPGGMDTAMRDIAKSILNAHSAGDSLCFSFRRPCRFRGSHYYGSCSYSRNGSRYEYRSCSSRVHWYRRLVRR